MRLLGRARPGNQLHTVHILSRLLHPRQEQVALFEQVLLRASFEQDDQLAQILPQEKGIGVMLDEDRSELLHSLELQKIRRLRSIGLDSDRDDEIGLRNEIEA